MKLTQKSKFKGHSHFFKPTTILIGTGTLKIWAMDTLIC